MSYELIQSSLDKIFTKKKTFSSSVSIFKRHFRLGALYFLSASFCVLSLSRLSRERHHGSHARSRVGFDFVRKNLKVCEHTAYRR